jgi:hypothetical protein
MLYSFSESPRFGGVQKCTQFGFDRRTSAYSDPEYVDDRHIAIQPFDLIEATGFFGEHVNNDIAVIEQDPLLITDALGVRW